MSAKVFDPRKLEIFLEKGRERNFVTYSEIMSFFPDVEKDVDGLDELYQMLDSRGIEVKEAREFLEVGEKAVKRRLESKIDPVQMYLKEIGQIPALTAHDEKELGQKDRSRRYGGQKTADAVKLEIGGFDRAQIYRPQRASDACWI